MFTFLENIRGATTDPNPIAIAIKNQSISSVEAGAEGSALLEFFGQSFVEGIPHELELLQAPGKGAPHNPSFPSKEFAKNDWS